MANGRVHEILKHFPDLSGDPVPPWFFVEFVPKEILKEITLIGLERNAAVLNANLAANKKAMDAISRVK